jgi:hypothetical protein
MSGEAMPPDPGMRAQQTSTESREILLGRLPY